MRLRQRRTRSRGGCWLDLGRTRRCAEASRHCQRHRRRRRSCWLELGRTSRCAEATQLLAGVGLDAEDGGQQQALQQEAAEVVAGALGVQQEQVGMMWMGGSQKLPQDTEYRYLGVQLSTDCGWKKHAEVLKDKCLRMKGMLEGVFRNKCLDSM